MLSQTVIQLVGFINKTNQAVFKFRFRFMLRKGFFMNSDCRFASTFPTIRQVTKHILTRYGDLSPLLAAAVRLGCENVARESLLALDTAYRCTPSPAIGSGNRPSSRWTALMVELFGSRHTELLQRASASSRVGHLISMAAEGANAPPIRDIFAAVAMFLAAEGSKISRLNDQLPPEDLDDLTGESFELDELEEAALVAFDAVATIQEHVDAGTWTQLCRIGNQPDVQSTIASASQEPEHDDSTATQQEGDDGGAFPRTRHHRRADPLGKRRSKLPRDEYIGKHSGRGATAVHPPPRSTSLSVSINDRPVQNITVRERMWLIDVVVGCVFAALFALTTWQMFPTLVTGGAWILAAAVGTVLARWHATGRPPQLPHPHISHPGAGRSSSQLTGATSHSR